MATRIAFSCEEETKLLKAIEHWNPRDRCLIQVGLNTGFRASELSSIRLSQVWDGIDVRNEITVERSSLKGGSGPRRHSIRSRTIPLNDSARRSIREYLGSLSAAKIPLVSSAPLFQSRQGPRGISRWRVNALVKAAAQIAGLPNHGRWGSHSLRKRFCRRIYEISGHNLVLTQAAMGHRHVTTTMAYLDAEISAVKNAILAIG